MIFKYAAQTGAAFALASPSRLDAHHRPSHTAIGVPAYTQLSAIIEMGGYSCDDGDGDDIGNYPQSYPHPGSIPPIQANSTVLWKYDGVGTHATDTAYEPETRRLTPARDVQYRAGDVSGRVGA